MTTNDIYQSPAYRRSRTAYYIQCVMEYLVVLLLSDAFLAKLLKSIGLMDSTIGIISSLTSLAFLIQIVTIFMMQRIHNIKKTVILIDISSMLCFMCVYLLPFIRVSQNVRTALVFATLGGGFFFKYMQLNLYYKWGNSFVNPANRGEFSAMNEAISMAAGAVFVPVIGMLVDRCERQGALDRSFMIIACVIAVLTVIDFAMLMLIHPYNVVDAIRQQKTAKEVLKNTLGNRDFRHIVIMVSLYDISRFFTFGFLGTYKTQELMMSIGTVQLVNIAANVLRCLLSKPFGRWSDRTSFAHVYRMGMWLCAIAFLLLVFTTGRTWWLIIGYTVFFNVGQAGISANLNNMTYSYVPIDYFVQAQAIRSSVAGILGFLASVLGSRILAGIQANGNRLFGFAIYGQQALAVISILFILVAILYNKTVIEKQRVMKQ